MGTGAALCGLCNFHSPCPAWEHNCPWHCICAANFSPFHSSSLPPAVSCNNTHCHRSRKERRTHGIWAELNHEAGTWPGLWEPAFCPKAHAIILCLASFLLIPSSSGSRLLFLNSPDPEQSTRITYQFWIKFSRALNATGTLDIIEKWWEWSWHGKWPEKQV